jgi:gamma-glutamyl hercynylcysteine S-oxide synthase
MAARADKSPPVSPGSEQALDVMSATRGQTLALVAHLDDAQLEAVHSPIMSPLVWDLGHIAAYEDLWLAHRYGGLELLRPDLAALYDAFETPRAVRGDVDSLGPAGAREYLEQVRDRTAAVIAHHGIGDGTLFELVIRHELQHCETMRQTLAIAGLLAHGEPPAVHAGADAGWELVPAGPFAMGADGEGFSYDNERPRHTVEVAAFEIARLPVVNASWMRFSEGGGYERREWWSDEGWAWKEEYDATHHPAVAAGNPDDPVCHVSWFEADAFARAHGARLPSEAEWEKAATWGQQASLQGAGAARTAGLLDAVGYAWEWTSSCFGGYPGFEPYPYREYSQVFFGDRYRVLRGGSWAASRRVATSTFRNWDLPQRRQIFSGLRLARSA